MQRCRDRSRCHEVVKVWHCPRQTKVSAAKTDSFSERDFSVECGQRQPNSTKLRNPHNFARTFTGWEPVNMVGDDEDGRQSRLGKARRPTYILAPNPGWSGTSSEKLDQLLVFDWHVGIACLWNAIDVSTRIANHAWCLSEDFQLASAACQEGRHLTKRKFRSKKQESSR